MYLFNGAILFSLLSAYTQAIQVKTTEGYVMGYMAGNQQYHAFYGIPYAGPTEGKHRFKAPVPPKPHKGVFHAIDSNIVCAQYSQRGPIGVENCLILNIFTNSVISRQPVIVWLNSEEYSTTNIRHYSFQNFVEENIVFVSVNFRVSIFGFLCLQTKDAPGNAGLRDVLQALKWINANIEKFGGDKKNVILMGHGSGAAMVDIITLSPLAVDLVHKAITISGSALAPWAVALDPIGYAQLVGEKIGYSGKSNRELSKLLINTNACVLQSALKEFHFKNNTLLFAPCIESVDTNDPILTDTPSNLLKSGNFKPIPYMAGYVTREGTLRAKEVVFSNWLEEMNKNFKDFLPADLNFGSNKLKAEWDIKDFYFGYSRNTGRTNIEDYFDYIGDTMVVVPVINSVKLRALFSPAKVRLFVFGYMGTMNSDWVYSTIPLTGVKHGDVLNYLFDYDLRQNDDLVSKILVTRFKRFAFRGTPNALSSVFNDTWLPVTSKQVNYLYIGGTDLAPTKSSSVFIEENRVDPHSITMNFWKDITRRYLRPRKILKSSGKYFTCNVRLVILSKLFIYIFVI